MAIYVFTFRRFRNWSFLLLSTLVLRSFCAAQCAVSRLCGILFSQLVVFGSLVGLSKYRANVAAAVRPWNKQLLRSHPGCGADRHLACVDWDLPGETPGCPTGGMPVPQEGLFFPSLLFKRNATGPVLERFEVLRILLVIFLMIIFGGPKFHRRKNLGHNRFFEFAGVRELLL